MEVDQHDRLREDEPTFVPERSIPLVVHLAGLLIIVLIATFILFPKQVAAIFY